MSEKVTGVVTDYRRKLLAQITSGQITALPAVAEIALGSGGVDEAGEPLELTGQETALQNEVARYAVEKRYPAGETGDIEAAVDYIVVIPPSEHVGVKFNEMALVDAEGGFCALKTMYTKQKDAEVEFTFEFRDAF